MHVRINCPPKNNTKIIKYNPLGAFSVATKKKQKKTILKKKSEKHISYKAYYKPSNTSVRVEKNVFIVLTACERSSSMLSNCVTNAWVDQFSFISGKFAGLINVQEQNQEPRDLRVPLIDNSEACQGRANLHDSVCSFATSCTCRNNHFKRPASTC